MVNKYKYLELLTTIFKWMFGETTIFYIKFGIIQLKQPFINGCLGFQVSMYMYVCACILLSSNHILTSFTPFHHQIFTLALVDLTPRGGAARLAVQLKSTKIAGTVLNLYHQPKHLFIETCMALH